MEGRHDSDLTVELVHYIGSLLPEEFASLSSSFGFSPLASSRSRRTTGCVLADLRQERDNRINARVRERVALNTSSAAKRVVTATNSAVIKVGPPRGGAKKQVVAKEVENMSTANGGGKVEKTSMNWSELERWEREVERDLAELGEYR
jgi:hypothetical protein